jgi:hypothetical protein
MTWRRNGSELSEVSNRTSTNLSKRSTLTFLIGLAQMLMLRENIRLFSMSRLKFQLKRRSKSLRRRRNQLRSQKLKL